MRVGEHKYQRCHREAADEEIGQQVRVLVPKRQVDARDLRKRRYRTRETEKQLNHSHTKRIEKEYSLAMRTSGRMS